VFKHYLPSFLNEPYNLLPSPLECGRVQATLIEVDVEHVGFIQHVCENIPEPASALL